MSGVKERAETLAGLQKMKNKKTIDGYFYDGKNSHTIFKDKYGKVTIKKDNVRKKKK